MAERQDIVEGLKNALERGYSLDVAVSSFINAGYSRQDVEDSARTFGGTFLQQTQQPQQNFHQANVPQPSQPSQIQRPQAQLSQSESRSGNVFESKNITVNAQNVSVQPNPEKKGWGLIITLIIVLVILLGGLFALVFAREQVTSLLAAIGITF